jgi:transposase
MAAAYSMDLRQRVIQDSAAGVSSRELAERYHVSRAWVDALKQRWRETRSMAPLEQTKSRRRVLKSDDDPVGGVIAGQPDATLGELRASLRTTAGLATIWRAINHLDHTSKTTVHADEKRRL